MCLDPEGNGTDILDSAQGKVTTVKQRAGQLLACMAALQHALPSNGLFLSVQGVDVVNPTVIQRAAAFVRVLGMGMALTPAPGTGAKFYTYHVDQCEKLKG